MDQWQDSEGLTHIARLGRPRQPRADRPAHRQLHFSPALACAQSKVLPSQKQHYREGPLSHVHVHVTRQETKT